MRPFAVPLRDATLVRRYRRFLADVRTPDGRLLTVHCPNPGAMTGCDRPGSAILLSRSGDPRRKLRYTWELVRPRRAWVAVNTALANRVVGHWLRTGRLGLGEGPVRAEPSLAGSRLDFLLGERCVVEVKSVTLAHGRTAAFPDAVTLRGRRHVRTLARLRASGYRAVLLFFVARADVDDVRPADEIDPAYGRALRRAAGAGVEIHAVRAHFSRRGVRRGPALPVRL